MARDTAETSRDPKAPGAAGLSSAKEVSSAEAAQETQGFRRKSARIEEALRTDGVGVLVTIVHTEGSCYLKAGAQLFVHRLHEIYGVVSGGCLEQAIIEEAIATQDSAAAHLQVYDTSDPSDLDFGFGMGCGGCLWAFFECVEGQGALSERLYACGGVEAIILASEHRPWLAQRFQVETLRPDAPPLAAYCHMRSQELSPDQRSLLVEGSLHGVMLRIALLRRETRPHLAIFGAGPGVWPLAALAQTLGWPVDVYDHRADLLQDFPRELASASLLGRGEKPPLAEASLRAAIVMTHHFTRDVEILSSLLTEPYNYIGVLGSPQRCTALRRALLTAQPELAGMEFPALHAPAGLQLGGRDIEAMALSIIAEVQLTCRGGHGRSLRILS